jgi:dihydroflavonol-4-reductase
LEAIGAIPVEGDILELGSLERLVAGSDWVFHVAGVNEVCSPDPDLMDRVNIDGTRNVVDACRKAGVRRLVHTSSAAALGEAPGEIGDESTDHRGVYLTRYERSKHLSELIVKDAAGIDAVVVSPSSVQGPGRATGTGRIILDVLAGKLHVLVDARISIVDIDDCALGLVLAAERGAAGQRYVLSGSRLTVRQAVTMLSTVTGTEIRARYLPAGLVGPAASVVEAWSKVRGRPPVICRETARVVRAGAWYDGSKAARDLAFEYTPIEATMQKTVAWFREQSLI